LPTRWNVPVVEADPYHYEVTPEGPREGIRAAFCDEDIEMFRTGYKCIECWEPLDSAYPDKCFLCEFPVKALQADTFAERFAGHRELGSRINADEELERLARQRDERERREGLKSKGIVIPRGVRVS
jgi:DNA-directed RNA polymerase subunit RPC12/RpoP